MRKMVGIVIDDNQAHAKVIAQYSAKLEWVEILETFNDAVQGMAYLRKYHVDFIVLDVEMGQLSGLEVMESLPKEIHVILYTGHEKYEDEGYVRKALDVLKKPTTFTRFAVAMRRTRKELGLDLDRKELTEGDDFYFLIKGEVRYMRTLIRFKEIIYIENKGGFVLFHLVGEDQPKICNEPFKKIKNVLPEKWFMQIHQSFIINTDFFRCYKNGGVEMTIGNISLKTGKAKNFPDFFDWINSKVL